MMGQRGDGLADGGQPLGLDLGVVKGRVLDGQPGLVANRDHERELVLRELAASSVLAAHDNGQAAFGTDIGVEDSQGGVPPLDRYADRLANVVIDDRLRGAEPLVRRRVGGDHPLPLLEHVIDDRPRDRHPFVGLDGFAPADGLGNRAPLSSLSRIAPRLAPIDSKTSSRIWGESESMSRIWLIAWVVRYMTERLASRWRSHPAAISGWSRTREPSPEGMLLRMAERSSGLLRLSRSTRAVRSRLGLEPPSL